jgi:hypothetical protein
VIAADFSGDGNMDLAVANNGDNTVSILLNNPAGTFTAQTTLVTGSGPYALAAGDFNSDGKQDLVVANSNDNTVSVFLGNGDGTFMTPSSPSTGAYPSSVATGDFNHDGFLDVAVANQNDHSISILLGNGDGTFQPAVTSMVGTTDVARVAAGYFHNATDLDLAITSTSSNKVYVLLGAGDGTFMPAVAYDTGGPQDHPIAVSAFDLNNDGKVDLAVTNLNANNVAVLRGNGDGTFQARVTYPVTNGAIHGPAAMTSGDFNGDNKVDLVVTNQQNNTVSILLGNGDATFQSPLEFSSGNNATGVAAADFNGDGRLDLAVANHDDNNVSLMLHLPQPPTNLAATNVTANQVPLTWTASTTLPVVNYNVYRASNAAGPYSLQGSSMGTSFPDPNVTTGNTYYYYVTTVTALSPESVKSNVVSVTTP